MPFEHVFLAYTLTPSGENTRTTLSNGMKPGSWDYWRCRREARRLALGMMQREGACGPAGKAPLQMKGRGSDELYQAELGVVLQRDSSAVSSKGGIKCLHC